MKQPLTAEKIKNNLWHLPIPKLRTEYQKKIAKEFFIPLSCINSIQAEAEKGCNKTGQSTFGYISCGNTTQIHKKKHLCRFCKTIIATCKRIKNEHD